MDPLWRPNPKWRILVCIYSYIKMLFSYKNLKACNNMFWLVWFGVPEHEEQKNDTNKTHSPDQNCMNAIHSEVT